MWPSRVAMLVLALCFLALCSQVQGSFHGICYSPYSAPGVCRTVPELEEDLSLMLQHTRRIRLYSMDCPEVLDILFKKASQGVLSLLLGVWIENSPRDQKEVDTLIEYLQKYPTASLEGIVIGNEVLFRHQATPDYMAYRVLNAKDRVVGLGNYNLANVDVFSVEETPNPGVVGVSDAVGVNIHPYYDLTLPQKSDPVELSNSGVQRFKEKLAAHRSQYPGKKVVVTEVGWPSRADIYSGDHQLASDRIQLDFVLAFLKYTQSNPFPYYWFEFKNADWKKFGYKSDGYSEYNFGLVNSAGVAKAALHG